MRLVTKSQGICIEANYPANTTDMNALTFFMDDIKMKPKKLVYGVGTNDADYAVQQNTKSVSQLTKAVVLLSKSSLLGGLFIMPISQN